MIIEVIKTLHAKWIGPVEDTPLRTRIFHEVSLIALIGLLLAISVNLFIDVPGATLAMLMTWSFVLALYLLSRYARKHQLSIILFSSGISVLMAVNYFVNSGIQGPTLILYLLALVFTLAMTPLRPFVRWMAMNVGIVGTLLLFEYYREDLVGFTYSKRGDLFLDTATTYLAVVACIGAILYYLISSYEKEKNNAIAASSALKEANDSKTRLLSILSHDLRSPLNSIESYLETLYAYDLSVEERQYVEKSAEQR